MTRIGPLGAGLMLMLTLATQPPGARQLVLVKTDSWESVSGELRRYERGRIGWIAVGDPIPVVVGRHGMAWGRGLNRPDPLRVPIKREGDGKSPAGVFRLGSAFGYATVKEAKWVKLPYAMAGPTIECVDDAKSAHYNQVLDRSRVPAPDWSSSERMRRQDELYRWGVVVDHNAAPAEAGAGSCIFIHIWEGPGVGTSGCTAMEAARVEELLRWLDPKKGPILVQLPADEYTRLRGKWRLP